MDPLSLTANIIAVIDAAAKVFDGFSKISTLKHATQEVLQFTNEISDFRAVITLAQETLRHVSIDGSTPDTTISLYARMNEKLSRALEILNELEELIHGRILHERTTSSTTDFKISKMEWLRTSKHVRRLFASLRDLRSQISENLNTVTASGIPRARAALTGVVLESHQLNATMQTLETRTLGRLSDIQPALQAINATLRETRSSVNESAAGNAIGPTFTIRTSIYGEKKCDHLCMCQCHHSSTLKSPSKIHTFVGTLLLGYHGARFWYRHPCNEKFCQRSEVCLLKLAYIFPAWFIKRAIFFLHRWEPTCGHSISIRTPRVVKDTALPIFINTFSGNVERMFNLFAQGLASPFDVCGNSFDSPLHFAVTSRQPEVCEFLLSQHADPSLQNSNFCSPLDYVWDAILSRPGDPTTLQLQRIFSKFLDIDDDLQHRKLSTLHKTVLKLSSIPLLALLQLSTAELDTQCSQGRTPLDWAVRRDDPEVVQTLINFGANIDIATHSGEAPIHTATRHSIKSLKILLHTAAITGSSMNPDGPELQGRSTAVSNTSYLKSFLDRRTKFDVTPLFVSCFFDFTGATTALLLDYSADVNGYAAYTSALTVAVQYKNHAAIKLLLQHGADTSIFDKDKMGILHYAAIFGDLETLRILHCADIRVEGGKGEDINGDTPLQLFDNSRSTFLTEEPDTRARCREVFVEIISRQDTEPASREERVEVQEFYDFDEPLGPI